MRRIIFILIDMQLPTRFSSRPAVTKLVFLRLHGDFLLLRLLHWRGQNRGLISPFWEHSLEEVH